MACQLILAGRPLINQDVAVAEHIDLPGSPESVPTARRFIRSFLSDVAVDVAEDCELLGSELVTNVVMHARTRAHLGISRDDDNVLVCVQDFADDTGYPPAPTDDDLAESGRGMEIVATLADDFGWMRLPNAGSKILWFAVGLRTRDPLPEAVGDPSPLELGGDL